MKAEADRDVCIGAGMCALTAPAVYDQDNDGTVVVLKDEVPASEESAVRDAADSCPSGAITFVE
jgi:ferredoxin